MNNGSPAGLLFRPACAADIPAMIKIERQTPAAAHWTQRRYESIFAGIGVLSQVRRSAWVVGHGRCAAQETLQTEAPEQILGFLVAHQVDREWELENVVVAQEFRRKGVGAFLLQNFIAHGRLKNGASMLLEVRESNQAARALYSKLGFIEVGLRKDYYSNPSENAVLYRLILLPEP